MDRFATGMEAFLAERIRLAQRLLEISELPDTRVVVYVYCTYL